MDFVEVTVDISGKHYYPEPEPSESATEGDNNDFCRHDCLRRGVAVFCGSSLHTNKIDKTLVARLSFLLNCHSHSCFDLFYRIDAEIAVMYVSA